MQVISLTAEDAMCACSVATLQMLRKIAKQRNSDHGGSSQRTMRDRWADGIHGAMAEIALSHVLGLDWTPGGMHLTRGDVGNRIEVRATEHNGGHLIVYDTDRDESVFVLMVGHFPRFRLAGCILGAEAKRSEWFRAEKDPASYWVPQGALREIATSAERGK